MAMGGRDSGNSTEFLLKKAVLVRMGIRADELPKLSKSLGDALIAIYSEEKKAENARWKRLEEIIAACMGR